MAAAKSPNAKSNSKSGAKSNAKKTGKSDAQLQPQMKIVSVDSCINCKTRCSRGIEYMEKMSRPGAVGRGVPCILTLK